MSVRSHRLLMWQTQEAVEKGVWNFGGGQKHSDLCPAGEFQTPFSTRCYMETVDLHPSRCSDEFLRNV